MCNLFFSVDAIVRLQVSGTCHNTHLRRSESKPAQPSSRGFLFDFRTIQNAGLCALVRVLKSTGSLVFLSLHRRDVVRYLPLTFAIAGPPSQALLDHQPGEIC